MLAGVAGGVARRLALDPSLVRVVWAVLIPFTGGIAFLVYVVMAIVVPEEPPGGVVESVQGRTVAGGRESHRPDRSTGVVLGAILILVGSILLAERYLPDFDLGLVWPFVLVGLGAILLLASIRRDRRQREPSPRFRLTGRQAPARLLPDRAATPGNAAGHVRSLRGARHRPAPARRRRRRADRRPRAARQGHGRVPHLLGGRRYRHLDDRVASRRGSPRERSRRAGRAPARLAPPERGLRLLPLERVRVPRRRRRSPRLLRGAGGRVSSEGREWLHSRVPSRGEMGRPGGVRRRNRHDGRRAAWPPVPGGAWRSGPVGSTGRRRWLRC